MKELGLVWYLYKEQVYFMLLTIIIVLLFFHSTVISILFAVLSLQFLYYLYKKRFNPKAWFMTTLQIIGLFIVLDVLNKLLGGYGWLGLAVIIIVLVAWRIWMGRDLYNRFTLWVVDRLKGRSREEFKFKKDKEDKE